MKRILIGSIRFYQKNISVRSAPKCKYYPTCSHYAVEAIQTHGAFKGFFLSIWRILRCNPFSKGGVDPVPKKVIKGKKER
jgi:putative membrane protein insertion efficiency factor